MTLPRRQFLHLGAAAAALPAVSRLARAQAYPSRPVHVIVGFGPGSGPDITSRLLGQLLSERLGQSFVIDNRPGAASNIATEAAARAPADGYTLLLVSVTNAINAALYDNLHFNFIRDIAPVANIGAVPFVMLVNPSFPARTVGEFIAYAKAHPGKVNMASAGNGSAPHIFGELFKMMAGVDLFHVTYRESYWPDLIAGQTQVVFAPTPSSLGYIQGGQLRVLAATTAARLEVLPDIPTVAESVPGYEASGWLGVGAPGKTPAEFIEKINNELRAVFTDPRTKSRFTDLGTVLAPMTRAEFGKFVADETEKWGKVIAAANIKAG